MAKPRSGRSGNGRGRSGGSASSRASDEAALGAVAAALGHSFSNTALLREALTHGSVAGRRTNERLEFLGDRVLGLVIASWLLERYPDLSEGELAPRFNALVRRETCAAVAEAAGFADALILGHEDVTAGARARRAVLADACEAAIAALYLDGGFAVAEQFIRRAFRPHVDALRGDMRDAKSVLQDWTQGLSPPRTPRYVETARTGPDHAPRFTVAAEVEGHGAAEGAGASKRDAEQAAARAMLMRLGLLPGETP